MTFISYFLIGYVGVAVVLASSIVTIMRIWDGVTDPFVGYIIGYTAQCVVIKSAQTCLTNDPKQRPVFSVFNGIYTAAFFALMPLYSYTYLLPKHQYQMNDGFFAEQWRLCFILSLLCSIIAFISLIRKDRTEYFGTGKSVVVKLKDYWDIIKNNRAMQMLIVAASTDKLALQMRNDATITLIVYAIICGNAAVSGLVSSYTTIPNVLFIMFGAGVIAAKLGQKRSIQFGSWGGAICAVGLILLFSFGEPTTLSLPGDGKFAGWTLFTVLFMIFKHCI